MTIVKVKADPPFEAGKWCDEHIMRVPCTMCPPPSPRCKHEKAVVADWVESQVISLRCSCGVGWSGLPYSWRSRRGIRHSPPKWVQRFIDACKVDGMDLVNHKTSGGAKP
jgi:hypothetical protein